MAQWRGKGGEWVMAVGAGEGVGTVPDIHRAIG